MGTRHTEGPWAVYDGQFGDHSGFEGGGFQIIMGPYDGGAVRHIRLINYADGQYEGDTGYEEAKANAHLIAAAPDMLDALHKAREWLEGWGSAEHQLSVVNDAIAKATQP